MSLQEFWQSVRTGAKLYAPTRVVSDSPRMNTAVLDDILARADLWLAPKVVKGYDPVDFSFLPPERRAALTAQVDEFRQVAEQVDPRGQATYEQIARAKPLFREIVQALEFDRFADPEAFRIGKQAEADPRFPSGDVSDVRYRMDVNWEGEPVVRIMAYVPESEDEAFLRKAADVRERIQNIVFEIGEPYWPHVSLRKSSDLDELPEVGDDE